MNPSSFKPSLQEKYLRIGRNGCNSFGNKHCNLSFSNIVAFNIASFDWTFITGLNMSLNIGGNFCSTVLNFCPNGISGLTHLFLFFLLLEDMKLRRFVEAGGSVNKIAVAGTVLGTKNPLSSKIEENTDNITLPSNPIVSAETSAKTAGI